MEVVVFLAVLSTKKSSGKDRRFQCVVIDISSEIPRQANRKKERRLYMFYLKIF